MTRTSVIWLRRDLRLADHPALLAARDEAGQDGAVLALYVVDDALWGPSGANRRAFLAGALRDLSDRLDGRLAVVHGDPVTEVPRVAKAVAATGVHVSADYGPYGARRDEQVEKALAGVDVPLVRTGSPYAVAPGRVTKDDGTPFKVFTPFSKRWVAHGWRAPARTPRAVTWAAYDSTHAIPSVDADATLPEPTEAAGRKRWKSFLDDIAHYGKVRNDLAGDRTSRMSPYLRWGLVHPRTLLADLPAGDGARTYRNELCWREFYADVLWNAPGSARASWNVAYDAMPWDTGKTADARFDAWAQGRTGYPVVDAAMRQLLAEGWMHNRARMLVASFLVKDLHIDWRRGARHFMQHLVDGDLASNQHGWQWTAGSGTDPSPFFRVFNPIGQGRTFDQDGDYVRRYVPELRGIEGAEVHEPWDLPDGVPSGYPERIVDHAAERQDALARYEQVKAAR